MRVRMSSQRRQPDDCDHRHPKEVEVVLTDAVEGFRHAEKLIMDGLAAHHYPEASRFAIRLALEEAVVNAFKHGSKGIADPRVEFAYFVGEREVFMRVKDPGPGFKPDCLPDPTSPENLERPGGRGVMLMKAFMSRIEYVGCGNEIVMVYSRP